MDVICHSVAASRVWCYLESSLHTPTWSLVMDSESLEAWQRINVAGFYTFSLVSTVVPLVLCGRYFCRCSNSLIRHTYLGMSLSSRIEQGLAKSPWTDSVSPPLVGSFLLEHSLARRGGTHRPNAWKMEAGGSGVQGHRDAGWIPVSRKQTQKTREEHSLDGRESWFQHTCWGATLGFEGQRTLGDSSGEGCRLTMYAEESVCPFHMFSQFLV